MFSPNADKLNEVPHYLVPPFPDAGVSLGGADSSFSFSKSSLPIFCSFYLLIQVKPQLSLRGGPGESLERLEHCGADDGGSGDRVEEVVTTTQTDSLRLLYRRHKFPSQICHT